MQTIKSYATTRLIRQFIAAGLAGMLVACGGGGGADTCSATAQKEWVRSWMDNLYYWRDNVSSLLGNSALHSSESTALTYYKKLLWNTSNGFTAGKDHFSYVISEADNNLQINGQSLGYGIDWTGEKVGTCLSVRVRYVEPASPAALAGVQRGDTLTSVNGTAVSDCSGVTAEQLAIVLPNTVVNAQFNFKVADGSTRTVNLTSKVIDEQPVLISKVLTGADNRPVGYLMLNTFMAVKARDQLIAAFTQFKSQGIQDLVLDLRYNGGGYVSIAADLSAMIAGSQAANKTFLTYKYNSLNQSRNETYLFPVNTIPSEAQLGLSRVYVLTTANTASASELVINSLKPVLANVIQIGTTSYGKPVGMVPTSNCGYVYAAINFESLNANGEGGYYDGIAPTATCTVSDNLSTILGDKTEPLLAAAIQHRASGSCTTGVSALRSKAAESYPLKDEPIRNNMYLQR